MRTDTGNDGRGAIHAASRYDHNPLRYKVSGRQMRTDAVRWCIWDETKRGLVDGAAFDSLEDAQRCADELNAKPCLCGKFEPHPGNSDLCGNCGGLVVEDAATRGEVQALLSGVL